MALSRGMCKLPFPNGGNGYKSPKLSELYEHVFREKPIQSRLHGAAYDTQILTKIITTYEPIRSELGLGGRNVQKYNANSGIPGGILRL
jgi:hypothetical protein